MAEVNVRVGGRAYALACREGGEVRLAQLAAAVDAEAAVLTQALGAMAEGRLLLSAALTLADRLDVAEAALSAAADQAERLAQALEEPGRNA